ncbi:unnamed protein product [Calicophoron daubneyi]|uniref:SAM domain-containing protein n=1 Tax=Calicophoron daubneyi TaxID=300641 RepID=A0AAV2TCM3_CALDB
MEKDIVENLEICRTTVIPEASHWTIEQVCEWIESIGFPYYKNCFIDNYIDGKKLIKVDASTLPMMNITKFNHIQIITRSIRELLNLEEPNAKRTIRLPPRNMLGMCLEARGHDGTELSKMSFPRFVYYTTDKVWQPPLANEGIIFNYKN